MNKNLKLMITGCFVLVSVFLFADSGSAQTRKARGKNYTKSQVGNVIKRVETRVDNFAKNFDDSLDRGKLNGTKREDQLNKRVKNLENETDRLRRDFDKNDRWSDNRSQVRKVLDIASDIDKTMKNRKLGKVTESNWGRVKYELDTLAKIYNLPTVGSGSYG
ncbi:MAG: hypothetical protein KDB79_03850 [Acidobacteria bacterium]|nr:hypothetical protein [Acidobacteriota bacterium]